MSASTTTDDASPPPPRPETASEDTAATPLEPQPSVLENQSVSNETQDKEPADKEVAELAATAPAEEPVAAAPQEPPPPPPRPDTPDRVRELRAAVAAAKQRLAEKKAKAEEAEAALAAKPTREQLNADIAAAESAATVADEETEAFKKRTQTAKAALEFSRSLAARVQRLQNYGQRVTSWIDSDLTKSVESSTADSNRELDEELLSSIRNLKKRRDDEVLRVNAMVSEHRENNRILTGSNHVDPQSPSTARSDVRSPKKVTEHADESNKNNGSTNEEPLVSPTRSKAQDTSRRGVSSSPGHVRHDNVVPLPAQPSAVEIAAWDYDDYVLMNNDARLELNRAIATKESKRKLRVEMTKSLQHTRRMIEREIQSLTQRQNELAHQLQARRKRVVELEMANSSLASSLQYAHASLKMVWTKPVEECLIAQKGTQPALKDQPASTPTARKSKSQSH